MNKSVEESDNNLIKNRIHLDDFLANWLIHGCHLDFIKFSIALAIIISSTCLFTAWISGVLISHSDNVGFLQDWLGWFWALIVHPVLGGAYLWSTTAIAGLGYELKKVDNVNFTSQELDSLFKTCTYRWCKFLALAIAVFGSIIYYYLRSDLNTWTSSAFLPKLVTSAFVFLAIYMASMLAFNLIINIIQIYSLFDGKKIELKPLDPDQCGGLKSLSDYSLNTAYIAAVFGLMLGLGWYRFFTNQTEVQKYWFIIILTLIYIFASLICFFAPLFSAHEKMKISKKEFLVDISNQFQCDYMELKDNLGKDDEYLNIKMQKIENLKKLFDLTNQFSAWPFDALTIRKYAISISTPILPILIKLIRQAGILVLNQLNISL